MSRLPSDSTPGWILDHVICLAIAGLISFPLVMAVASLFGTSALGLGNVVVCGLVYLALRPSFRRPRPKPDTAAARRQAHGLGLPFVEADGSVSWPEPTAAERDEATHARMHARRLAAQYGPATAEWHMKNCRCLRAHAPRGMAILSEDPRCKALRKDR